jgi:tetratricopeptide (TPR) repeat protein
MKNQLRLPVVVCLLIIFSCFIFLLQTTVVAQNKTTTIKEYKKVFTTYPYSDPNPIPVVGKIYPYYRFDLYTDKPIEKEWTVVELENEYIKVMILPEIGGKIWTAIEKSTGKPFIYYNQVVKFRDVAMRGAWTSGGIEANYGIIGHTPNCATPVDYLTRRNEDGSASCFIGVLDLLTRTPWRLEVNLPADKAYFTTTSFWYNATPLEQPYYTWMNAGIKASGNLQFIYPGTHYLGHDGESASWPINKENGRDISFYEKNSFGGYKSYHVFGRYTDFFGGYWHDEDFGMGRYSPHDEKAGKKIWIWGLSQQGMIWEKLLTDKDGQYVEVQSGRLFNQSAERSTLTPFKHRGFAPYATDRWTEYWFPIKQIKGFVKANAFGALNLKEEDGGLKIYFCPLQHLNEKIEILHGDKPIYSKQIVLTPLEIFSDVINVKVNLKQLRVKLGNGKMDYSANAEDVLSRPLESPKDFDWNSVYGLYLQGKEKLRQRNYPAAMEKLEECLRKDPNYLPALVESAHLSYRGSQDEKAVEYAKKALSIETYDPAANYYYGLINLRRGKITDAKDGFDIAAMSTEYRSSAWNELSKIYFREGNFERAVEYANKSLDFNRYNLEAYQLIAVVRRLGNGRAKAAEALSEILTLDPLNHFVRFEKYLWESNAANRDSFVKLIRNEMPHETFLELAIWYYGIGLTREGERVLQLSPPKAETLYWQAYLKNVMRKYDYAIDIQKANAVSPHLTFPFRPETAEVLKWVIEKNSAWQPKYYLGMIYWSRNETTQAKALFESCGSIPGYAPFYAARAELLKASAKERSLSDLQKAAQLDQKQWRYGKLLVDRYLESGQFDEALRISQKYYEQSRENYLLGLLYARTLLLNRKYLECHELLSKLTVLPYEGSTDGRRLYWESQMMLALETIKTGEYDQSLEFIKAARDWPENMGAGKPYQENVDERLEDWLESASYEKSGKREEASLALNRIASFKKRTNNVGDLVSALALDKLGRRNEAEQILNAWVAKQPDSLLARWCREAFNGNHTALAEPEFTDERFRVMREWMKLHGQ